MTTVLVANVRTLAVELIRDRAAWVVAIGFPALFFVVALPDVTAGEAPASAALGQLAALAVLLVAVLQLPARIAHERASTWERFLHVLPGTPAIRVGARAVIGAALIAAATVPLLVIALLATPISESATTWLLWSVALLAGSIPALLLGITLAYVVRPKAVSPVATLVFVPMLYLGGFLGGPHSIPAVIRPVSAATPIRQYRDLLISLTGPQPVGLQWLWLVLWAVALGALATIAYRRSEGIRYR